MTNPRVTPRVTNTARKPGVTTGPKVMNDSPPKIADEIPENYRPGKFKEPIEQMYAFLGLSISPFLPRTGMEIVEKCSDLAIAWDKASRTNPAIKRTLEKLVTGGGWGTIIMAHAPIGIVAVQESGVMSKIPFLKRLFPQPSEEPTETDAFGNPIQSPIPDPAPFERREPRRTG